jgi:prolyl-tRNA synthetase
MFAQSKKFVEDNTRDASSFAEFENIMLTSKGFIRAFWCEDASCEAAIKEKTKASTRCLPLDAKDEAGKCVRCGNAATHRWLFAQSY